MDSDDEDVIFENSVLHQALQTIGMTDVETEPRLQMAEATPERQNGAGDGNRDGGTERSSRASGISQNARTGFVNRLVYDPKVLEEVHHYHRHQTLQRLISSKLLSEEDRLFLQFFVEENPPHRNPMRHLTAWNFPFIIILVASVLLINLLPMTSLQLPSVMLILNSTPVISAMHISPYFIFLFLLNFLWFFTVILPVMMRKRKFQKQVLSHMKEQDETIQDLEAQAWELMYLERKCLRLIRESELVARGFTVASQHHLASRQRDTSSSWERWCPELRKVMVAENITLMADLKKWVVSMMKNVPMICVDSDYNTLESLEVNSVTPDQNGSAGAEDSSSAAAGAETDNVASGADTSEDRADQPKSRDVVSPSKLSKSVDLLGIYVSGYIRRLTLCFYQNNFKDKTIDSYMVTRDCVSKSRDAMSRVRAAINQQYTFYKAVHKSDEMAGSSEESQRAQSQEKSQIYNLYVCVNSLDLHLQSLLHTTREVTTVLENRVDKERRRQAGVDLEETMNGELGVVSVEEQKEWSDVFKRIKLSLDSCKGCYEESLKHLQPKPTTEPVPSTQPAWRETAENPTDQVQLKMIPAEDPVIVDQVFEAVSEAVDDDVREVRPRYTAEDRARIQEQRETMKRLKQELYAVVGHRAISQREREEKALARAREEGVANEQSSAAQACLSAPDIVSDIKKTIQHTETPDMNLEKASESADLETLGLPEQKESDADCIVHEAESSGNSSGLSSFLAGAGMTSTLYAKDGNLLVFTEPTRESDDRQIVTTTEPENVELENAAASSNSPPFLETDNSKSSLGMEKFVAASEPDVNRQMNIKVQTADIQEESCPKVSSDTEQPSEASTVEPSIDRQVNIKEHMADTQEESCPKVISDRKQPSEASPVGPNVDRQVNIKEDTVVIKTEEESCPKVSSDRDQLPEASAVEPSIEKQMMNKAHTVEDQSSPKVSIDGEPGVGGQVNTKETMRDKEGENSPCVFSSAPKIITLVEEGPPVVPFPVTDDLGLLRLGYDEETLRDYSSSDSPDAKPDVANKCTKKHTKRRRRPEVSKCTQFKKRDFDVKTPDPPDPSTEQGQVCKQLAHLHQQRVQDSEKSSNSAEVKDCDCSECESSIEILIPSIQTAEDEKNSQTSHDNKLKSDSEKFARKAQQKNMQNDTEQIETEPQNENKNCNKQNHPTLPIASTPRESGAGPSLSMSRTYHIMEHTSLKGAGVDSGQYGACPGQESKTSDWVKISHQEMTSPGGSKIELLRQKDINLEKTLRQSEPCLPSPDPNSSFSRSLAMLAAARARTFNTSYFQEEEFGDISDPDDIKEVNS